MSNLKTVAVTQGTGQQGRAVARALAKAGYTVRVLTRDPQAAAAKSLFDGLKIELVRCDYNDLKSVQDAFEGVDIVFGNSIGDQELFMSPPGAVSKLAMSETEQGKRYADVAKAQGVKLFVWSCGVDAKKVSGGKYDIEVFQSKVVVQEYVESIGLAALFVQPGWYLDDMLNYQAFNLLPDGTISFTWFRASAEDKTTPMIYLEADFGRAVALLVQNYTDSQKFKVVRIYERSFSANEVVEAITRVTGKKAIYDFHETAGVKDCLFDQMVAFFGENYESIRFTEMDPALKALGFRFASLDDFVKEKVVPSLKL